MSESAPSPPHPPRWLRILVWNLGLLVLAGILGEVGLRLTMPFNRAHPVRFEPGVGWRLEPGQTVRWTNWRDFWTVSRTNSQGFLDREPVPPARARRTCHVTVIGDSFVEAREVPIADKFHIVLEALAAAELPRLRVTTSAFGWGGTGQVQQLALYDRYASSRSPKLIVLVFFLNDFRNNSTRFWGPGGGLDREKWPWPILTRDEGGTLRILPSRWPSLEGRSDGYGEMPFSWARALRGVAWRVERAARPSYLFGRLRGEWHLFRAWRNRRRVAADLRNAGSEVDPRAFSTIFPDIAGVLRNRSEFAGTDLRALLGDTVEETGFALDRFVERADRDGAELVLMVPSWKGVAGREQVLEVIHSLATARGIPVIDQSEYILGQGLDPERGHFRFDNHWNRTGHRWAAEALLEYLRSRPPASCGGREGLETADTLS